MKYVAEYVVSHRGNKHSRIVVLRSDSTLKSVMFWMSGLQGSLLLFRFTV